MIQRSVKGLSEPRLFNDRLAGRFWHFLAAVIREGGPVAIWGGDFEVASFVCFEGHPWAFNHRLNSLRAFIVQALASFDIPSQVAEAVKREFNVDVSRQQVESHDSTKRCSITLAKRWVEMFCEARSRSRNQMVDIPIADRGEFELEFAQSEPEHQFWTILSDRPV
jgi:hypothetical protein